MTIQSLDNPLDLFIAGAGARGLFSGRNVIYKFGRNSAVGDDEEIVSATFLLEIVDK